MIEYWILPAIPYKQQNPNFSDNVFSDVNVINGGVLERVPLLSFYTQVVSIKL